MSSNLCLELQSLPQAILFTTSHTLYREPLFLTHHTFHNTPLFAQAIFHTLHHTQPFKSRALVCHKPYSLSQAPLFVPIPTLSPERLCSSQATLLITFITFITHHTVHQTPHSMSQALSHSLPHPWPQNREEDSPPGRVHRLATTRAPCRRPPGHWQSPAPCSPAR